LTYESNSPTTALNAIDRALTIEPANTQFLVRRAQCLLALNERRHALDAADAVERCNPTDPAIWDAIGGVRSYANDQRGALAAYDRAVELAPQQPHTFLESFRRDYNARFGRTPASDHDAHRKLIKAERVRIDDIFSWQEFRAVTRSLTLQYDKVVYLIKPGPENESMRARCIESRA
jgi:predicted Zn-dependent protease